MLHVEVQDSPGLGVLVPPSEQLIIPLVGLVSDGQVTNKKYIKTFALCIQILSHSSLAVYNIRKCTVCQQWYKYVSNGIKFNQNSSFLFTKTLQ